MEKMNDLNECGERNLVGLNWYCCVGVPFGPSKVVCERIHVTKQGCVLKEKRKMNFLCNLYNFLLAINKRREPSALSMIAAT